MARERVYLDWNATAPLLPAARDALVDALDCFGNPSSVHEEGRRARALVEDARAKVAALAGVEPAGVTFTSGGTEAANLVLSPSFVSRGVRPDFLVIAAGEHACVLQGHRFPAERVRIAPLDRDGRVDLGALERLLASLSPAPAMIALQAANNETGVIQPVREAAALAHSRGGVLVCDAVQAAGRIDCSVGALDADALFFSGHKIGAPKGVGALALASADAIIEDKLARGGGQERGLRAGTENVAGIAAFGAAAVHALSEGAAQAGRLALLRDEMEEALTAALPELVVFGRGAPRLANTSAFALPGVAASTLLIALDLEGYAVSSGSACSSGRVKASHVLAAMGAPPSLAGAAVRTSLGSTTTRAEIDGFVHAFVRVADRMGTRRKSAA